MRYHTVLHVLNTVALRDYGGWITGVQIGADYSRIDFKIEGFSAAMCSELEQKVNAVLNENHAVKSYFIPEEEFRKRDDLLRTLEVKPPVSHGRVRVVEIQGFDAQACGGTHVSTTSEVGRFSVFRTENKGKINKRLYVRLESRAAEKEEWHGSTVMNDLVIRPYQTQDEAAILDLWLQCNLVVPQNNPDRDIKRKLQVNPEWFLVGVA